jgi:hypothetical protein
MNTNIDSILVPTNRFLGRFSAWLFGLIALGILLPLTAHAITTLSQSYTSSEKLAVGSIVSLKSNTADQVIAASSTTSDSLLGVVITTGSSLLSLSSDQANQVQVATTGTEQVLVSDINGPVRRGDHITASPINGVGMKATDNVRIIGIAQSDLTATAKQTYKDKSNQEHSVAVGDIPVLINVAYFFKQPDKTIIPGALQNVANALAGKDVNTAPILIAGAIFLIMLIVISSIIYSMIRSSIISVGRNPMSQSAIYRDLIQLSALVIGILAVGLIAIYLVLTRL